MIQKVATILKPHGVHGAVKVHSMVENLADFIKIAKTKNGDSMPVKSIKNHKDDLWIVKFTEITDMNEAEAIAKTELFCQMSDFPKLPNGELYEFQAIGLPVFEENTNSALGHLTDFSYNQGGKILLITPTDPTLSRGNINQGLLHVLRNDVITINAEKIVIKPLKIYLAELSEDDLDDEDFEFEIEE